MHTLLGRCRYCNSKMHCMQYISLNTTLEAVAICSTIFKRLITVCSFYIPPDFQLSSSDFEGLVGQLPEPCILIGDLNARNFLWGSSRTDARDRLIEKFLTSSGACLFNKKQFTHLHLNLTSGSPYMVPILPEDLHGLVVCLENDRPD